MPCALVFHATILSKLTWYSSHGTFRPSLKGLVQQNSEEFVKETTIAGFSAEAESWNDSMNILTKLKGIGPATAALLLSTSNPEELPFFSDEIFRWAFWQDKTGDRWDHKIKYSLKEYRELKGKIDELTDRIGRGAIEIEKVAYVLGKREVDLGAPATADQIHQEADADEKLPDEKAPGRDKANHTRSKRELTQNETQNEDAKPEQPNKRQKTAASSTSQRVTRSSGKANTGAS
jgi:hypothetical protein